MSNYTKVNLSELENMAPKHGHGDDMETRFASKPLELQQSGLGFQKVLPGRTVPYKHKHDLQEEVFIVIAGSGEFHLDDDVVPVKPLDTIRMAPEVVRTVTGGPEGLEMIIYSAPKTEGSDFIMV